MPPNTRQLTPDRSRVLQHSIVTLGISAATVGTLGALGSTLTVVANPGSGPIASQILNKAREFILNKTWDRAITFVADSAARMPLIRVIAQRWQRSDAAFAQPELSACMGGAIAQVLSDLSQDAGAIPNDDDRRTLAELAKQAPNRWARIAAFPGTAHQTREGLEEAIVAHLTALQESGAPNLARTLSNLGAKLSKLGRHEEALLATQESVDICRRFAKQGPERFLRDLALSCGAHGMALANAGKPRAAAASFEEGLRALMPLLQVDLAAFGHLAGVLHRNWRRYCQVAHEVPDAELLAALKALLGEEEHAG